MRPNQPARRASNIVSLLSAALAVLVDATFLQAQDTATTPSVTLSAGVIPSSVDGAPQKLRYDFPAKPNGPVPLLVWLHTWSGDVRQNTFVPACVEECRRRGWAFVHPDFRGPNVRPEACGSPLAVQDVVDAVRWVESQIEIDPQRRYVAGVSGGGHMTLVMAGRHPELWAGASAWVPVTDLTRWHAESVARKNDYANQVVAVCGGLPGTSPAVDLQYRDRSPVTYLANAKGLPIDINVGITDGHTGAVPVDHSLRAFNVLAAANGGPQQQFTEAEMVAMTDAQEVPAADRSAAPQESERMHPILLRRQVGPARVTVFDGGHDGDPLTAIRWLAEQRRAP